jgi:hypothetical protein
MDEFCFLDLNQSLQDLSNLASDLVKGKSSISDLNHIIKTLHK